MFRLRRFLKDYIPLLIIGPLCKLTEAVLELFIPLVTADIIDNGVMKNDSSYVLNHGALMVLMGALGLGFALVCQKSASIVSQGFGTKLRNAMFAHINKLSHAELDKLGTPSLITRMTSDINQLQLAVAMLIRLVIRAPFLVIGALIMACTIDLKMSLIFFAASPLIALVLYMVMTKSVPFFKDVQGKLDKVSLLSRETLSGNRVIRAFNKQDESAISFEKANSDLARTSVRVGRLSALLSPVTYIIAQAAIIAIVWFGSVNVNAGDLQTGEIIALVNYMTQILLAMIVVSNLVVIFTKAFAGAARVNEVFDTVPSVKEKTGERIEEDENAPAVEFRDVCFGYGDGGDVLSNISFTAPRGSTIGIIGGTGSGKSTLISLIPRFYDPREGQVLVNGVDAREYPFSQLREGMGIVPQKAVLQSGTIRSNLLWSDNNADDEQIEKALRISQAYEFVSKLPEGIDSEVSAGGSNFSGGQRQRLTIARALVKTPEILILDDSASALDMATDARLRAELDKMEGMTVFIISQRVAAVRSSDKILVLDGGHIAAQGTHEELLEGCELYHEICSSQGMDGQEGSA